VIIKHPTLSLHYLAKYQLWKSRFSLLVLWRSYSRRCRLRWTTSGCSSDARLSTLAVNDSSLTDWQLDERSDSWRLQRSLSRDWLSICRHARCQVSSRQLSISCFSVSRAAVRSSMNRWYCCSTREHELAYVSYTQWLKKGWHMWNLSQSNRVLPDIWNHTVFVTCHLTQVNVLHLNPSQRGWYSIYLSQKDRRLSWPRWLVTYLDGLFVCRQQPIQEVKTW